MDKIYCSSINKDDKEKLNSEVKELITSNKIDDNALNGIITKIVSSRNITSEALFEMDNVNGIIKDGIKNYLDHVKDIKKSEYTIEVATKDWTRKEAENDPETLYIFTDNTDRSSGQTLIDPESDYAKKYGKGKKYPESTQAVLRGLNNAFPISTQRYYHDGATYKKGQWNDSDAEEFSKVIKEEIGAIKEAWKSGKYKRIKIGKGDGFFNSNISNISQARTPKLYKILKDALEEIDINIEDKVFDKSLPITKIISGGQTGVDTIGLKVAKALGIETGGTAPKGFKRESNQDNEDIKSFGLEEITDAQTEDYWRRNKEKEDKWGRNDYTPRTELNVINSDGTVYFSNKNDSAGRNATLGFAGKHGKPFIENPTAKELREWIIKNNIKTLNVAGNRASALYFTNRKGEKIYDDFKPYNVLTNALSIQTEEDSKTKKGSKKESEKKESRLEKDIREAKESLKAERPLSSKDSINLEKDNRSILNKMYNTNEKMAISKFFSTFFSSLLDTEVNNERYYYETADPSTLTEEQFEVKKGLTSGTEYEQRVYALNHIVKENERTGETYSLAEYIFNILENNMRTISFSQFLSNMLEKEEKTDEEYQVLDAFMQSEYGKTAEDFNNDTIRDYNRKYIKDIIFEGYALGDVEGAEYECSLLGNNFRQQAHQEGWDLNSEVLEKKLNERINRLKNVFYNIDTKRDPRTGYNPVFDAFIKESMRFLKYEGIKLDNSLVTTINSVEDENIDDEGEVENRSGLGLIKYKTVDPSKRMTIRMKSMLAKTPKMKYTKNGPGFEFDEMGMKVTMNPDFAHNVIQTEMAKMKGPKDFENALNAAIEKYPWLLGIKQRLEEDVDFKHEFFSKYRNVCPTACIITPEGTIKKINHTAEITAFLEDTTKNYENQNILGNNSLYKESGEINMSNAEKMRTILTYNKSDSAKERRSERSKKAHVLAWVKSILTSMQSAKGASNEELYEALQILRGEHPDFKNTSLEILLNNLGINTFEMNLNSLLPIVEKESEVKDYFGIDKVSKIDKILQGAITISTSIKPEDHLVEKFLSSYTMIGNYLTMVSDGYTQANYSLNGKMRNSYMAPDHVSEIISYISDISSRKAIEEGTQYIEDNYGKSNFFKNPITGEYDCIWLEKLVKAGDTYGDVGIREHFKHFQCLAVGGSEDKYQIGKVDSKTLANSLICAFHSINDDNHGNHYGVYHNPLYSDTDALDLFQFIRYNTENNDEFNELAHNFGKVLKQEVDRIIFYQGGKADLNIEHFNLDKNNSLKINLFPELNKRKDEIIKNAKAIAEKYANSPSAYNQHIDDYYTELATREVLRLANDFVDFYSDNEKLALYKKVSRIQDKLSKEKEEENETSEQRKAKEKEETDKLNKSISKEENKKEEKSKEELEEIRKQELIKANNMLVDFYLNDFFAQTQLIQILFGDIAYAKDFVDFVKRNKETYACGEKLYTLDDALVIDTEAYSKFVKEVSKSSKGIYKINDNVIIHLVRRDAVGRPTTMNYADFKTTLYNAYDAGNLSDEELDEVINKFEHKESAFTETCMYLEDDYATSNTWESLNKLLNSNNEMSAMDKDILRGEIFKTLQAYQGICTTDGQSFRTMDSFRKIFKALGGRWTDDMQRAYERIKSGTFGANDFLALWNPIKPFMYSKEFKTITVSKKDNEGKEVKFHRTEKVMTQHKNSEYMITAMFSMLNTALNQSPELKALNRFMEANHIDVAHFHSVVKIGFHSPFDITYNKEEFKNAMKEGKGVIKVSETLSVDNTLVNPETGEVTYGSYKTYIAKLNELLSSDNPISQEEYNKGVSMFRHTEDTAFEALKNQLYKEGTKEIDENKLKVLPMDDYMVVQPSADHLEDAVAIFGSQLRNIIPADLSEDFTLDITIGDKTTTLTRDEAVYYYNMLIVDTLIEAFSALDKKFSSIYEVQKALRAAMEGNDKYGDDIKAALELNDDGTAFKIPFNSPSLSNKIDELILSTFKNNIQRQKISGGNSVLVSNFGLSDKLKIKYRNDSKNQGIEYIEAYLPASKRSFYKDFLTPQRDGNNVYWTIDFEKLKANADPEILDIIGYRIPTEDKYSIMPIRIMGFMPVVAGTTIMLPSDIITMSGTDFDIDKLFLMIRTMRREVFDGKLISEGFKNFVGGDYISETVDKILRKKKSGYTEEEVVKMMESSEMFKKFMELEGAGYRYELPKYRVERPRVGKSTELNLETLKNISKMNNIRSMKDRKNIRNNMLIDFIWGVMTSTEGSKLAMHPGNFDNVRLGSRQQKISHSREAATAFKKEVARRNAERAKKGLKKLSIFATLQEMSKQEMEDFYADHGSQVVPASFTDYLPMHRNLMDGRDLIGIFAVNSSSHYKFQFANLTINKNNRFKIKLPGMKEAFTIKDVDPQNSPLTGKRIGDICGEFQAASPDNGKDPTLGDLGCSPRTASRVGFLARVGIEPQVIGYLNTGDDLIEYGKELYKTDDKENPKYDNPMQTLNTFDGNIEDIVKLIFKLRTLEDGEFLDEDDNKLAVQFYHWMTNIDRLADVLNRSSCFSRVDSPNGALAISCAEITQQQLKVKDYLEEVKSPACEIQGLDKIIDTELNYVTGISMPFNKYLENHEGVIKVDDSHSIDMNVESKSGHKYFKTYSEFKTELDDLLSNKEISSESYNNIIRQVSTTDDAFRETILSKPIPRLQAFYTLGISSATSLAKQYLPQLSNSVSSSIDYMRANTKTRNGFTSKAETRIVKKFYNELTKYLLSYDSIFSGDDKVSLMDKRNYYVRDFPMKFKQFLSEKNRHGHYIYNNVRNYNLIRRLSNASRRGIHFENIGGLSPISRDFFRDDMDNIVFNNVPEVRDFGEDLLMYSYYENGISFGHNNFGIFFSTAVYEAIPRFISSLNEANGIMISSPEFVKKFVNMFLLNNPELIHLIPKKFIIWDSVEKGIFHLNEDGRADCINKDGEYLKYVRFGDEDSTDAVYERHHDPEGGNSISYKQISFNNKKGMDKITYYDANANKASDIEFDKLADRGATVSMTAIKSPKKSKEDSSEEPDIEKDTPVENGDVDENFSEPQEGVDKVEEEYFEPQDEESQVEREFAEPQDEHEPTQEDIDSVDRTQEQSDAKFQKEIEEAKDLKDFDSTDITCYDEPIE